MSAYQPNPKAIALAAAVLCITPAVASTVDLGTVATSTTVDASISNGLGVEAYVYTQLLFVGPKLNMVIDGQTVAQILALPQVEGPMSPGVIDYLFQGRAAGTLSEDLPTPFTSTGQAGVSFTSTDLRFGNGVPVGDKLTLNPLDFAATYLALRGNCGPPCQDLESSVPSSTTTTVSVELGVYNGTNYMGEELDTVWRGSAAQAVATPEPRFVAGLALLMLAAVPLMRRRTTAAS